MSAQNETPLETNWCHIKETLTLLQLSSAQIRSSMQDSHISVTELGNSLGAISTSAAQIHQLLHNESDEVRQHAEVICEEVHKSVVACQFQDRVTQRLCHVTDALNHLGNLIASPVDSIEPDNWQKLQDEIRSSYTMESERIMFEHIMMGATVEEALEIYQHHFDDVPEDDSDDEIELF